MLVKAFWPINKTPLQSGDRTVKLVLQPVLFNVHWKETSPYLVNNTVHRVVLLVKDFGHIKKKKQQNSSEPFFFFLTFPSINGAVNIYFIYT